MDKEKHRNFVKNAKNEYKNINKIICPAFGNEFVYFNQKGFKHLVMKKGKYRTISEQIRRLKLIPEIVSVISNAIEFSSYRNSFGIDFWSISKIVNGIIIIVVIRQNSVDKHKYFLSVMDKVIYKNAKAP